MSILVEERFEDNDFVSRLDEAHECTEHSLVRASCNCDFCLRIYVSAKEGRVGFCNSFLEPRPSLRRCEPASQNTTYGVGTLVGEYWLQSTLSRASLAAWMMKLGGLYPLRR